LAVNISFINCSKRPTTFSCNLMMRAWLWNCQDQHWYIKKFILGKNFNNLSMESLFVDGNGHFSLSVFLTEKYGVLFGFVNKL